MADYPDNSVLYGWVTEWYREQKKNLQGADYFERVFGQQLKRSPLMAQYALLEKVDLQLAENRKADAAQTVARIKAISTSDPLVLKRVQVLEKSVGIAK